MAFFAVRKRSDNGREGGPRGARSRQAAGIATAALASLAVVAANPAKAQVPFVGTIGSGDGAINPQGLIGILRPNQFGYLPDPSNDDFDPIDMSGAPCAFIANPYIGVTLGIAGSFTVNWRPDGVHDPVHNVGGMISFGNVQGSRTYAADDTEALVGVTDPSFLPYDYIDPTTNRPAGYGVWPIPAHWDRGDGVILFDYSAYMRMQVTTGTTVTDVPVVGDGTIIEGPIFNNNVLSATYLEDDDIRVRLEIRVFRATAQLRWVFTNVGEEGRTINLRWTVPVRGAEDGTGGNRIGYFFESPGIGLSNDRRIVAATDIPDTLSFFGKRYDTDDINDPPFAAQFRFRGFGATSPSSLYIADAYELRPEDGTFLPDGDRPKLLNGVAVGAYFGPYVLAPGTSAEIITYYGNGNVTERPDADMVIAADAPQSMQFNSAAALDPEVVGNTTADPLAIGSKFLSPSSLQIYGGIYNRVESNPQTSLNLTNVRASLTLPTGLALTARPDGAAETAEKVIGNVNADRANDVSWYVRATAESFGTLTYQVNFASNERGSRQVSRTLDVPVTPFRAVTANSFQMIGFPFDFDPALSNNGDPSTVVNGLTSPTDEPVTFYRWVPDPQSLTGGGRYEIVNRLENGVGYFYRPNLNRSIFARGVKPWAGQAPLGQTTFGDTNQRQLILEPGWNMISNPYVYDLPLQFLRFVPEVNNPTAASQNFGQAINSGLVRSGIFFYNTATRSYDFVQSLSEKLKPWEAYWIFTTSRTALIYNVPTAKQTAVLQATGSSDPEPPTRKRGVIEGGRALVKDATTGNWRLQMVASRPDGAKDGAVILGATGSGLSESQRSTPKPPAPMGDYVYLGIVKNNGVGTRYAQDIRTGRGEQTWDLELVADKDGPVTLTWPNVGSLPRPLKLTITDKATRKVTSLRSSSLLTVEVKKGVPVQLTVTASPGASQPLVISGLRPVGGVSKATGSRSFAFTVTRSATVRGTIKTVSGKTVATVATGRAVTAGENRLTWNGRAQNGSPLPPGPYMLELTAETPDGEKTTVNQQFMSLQ
jgi:hypothetical protein